MSDLFKPPGGQSGGGGILSDIPQMTSKFVEIVPLIHRQVNGIPFAAIR